MLSVVIVSEQRKDLELIASSIIGGFQTSCSVNCFHEGTELFAFLERSSIPPDIFILQINLKNQGGYRLADRIRRFDGHRYAETPILFITPQSYNMVGFPMLATYRSYRRHNYISMPITRLDVQGKLGLYFDEILKKHTALQPLRPVFCFEHDEGVVFLPTDEIYYAEVKNRCLYVVTASRTYTAKRFPLQKLLYLIDSPHFVRCHKSFALNTAAVTELRKCYSRIWTANFPGGAACMVSETYLAAVRRLCSERSLPSADQTT